MARTFTYRCCPVCHSTMRSGKFCLDVGSGKATVEVDVNFARRRITFEASRSPEECQDGTPPHECRPPYSRKDWLERLKVAVVKAAAALGVVAESKVRKVEREVYPERFARQHQEHGAALWGALQDHAKRKRKKLTRAVGKPHRARGLRVNDGGLQRFNFAMPGRDSRVRRARVSDGGTARVALLTPAQAARETQGARVVAAAVTDGGTSKVAWRP